MSIGLFQATLQQRHLNALFLFFEWKLGGNLPHRGPRPLKECRSLLLGTLAEALSIVAKDRWNTRSWILQEAFVSGGSMILLFPREKNVSVRGWSMICHDMSLTEIGIKLEILQKCLEKSSAFFTSSPQTCSSIKVPGWGETLDRLRWFHPKDKPSHTANFWINDFKPRRTCNAATALSFLKHRNNDRVADILAIIANLCDYNQRLNTVELEKSQRRLSVCILALALTNGDLSLLSPEIYRLPRGLHPSEFVHIDSFVKGICGLTTIAGNEGNLDFTWVPSKVKQISYIEADTFNPGGPTMGRDSSLTYRLTNEGLSLLGLLWKIDCFIEIASIKDKYRESWSRLWCTNDQGEKRSSNMTEEWYGHRSKQERDRSRWLATTHIFFEVLMLLRAERQLAVADAIWQSVLNARWHRYSGTQEKPFPETVADFPEQMRVENRRGMFELDQSPDGAYYQKWLIDRIMLQGGLWFGRLVRLSSDQEYTEGFSVPSEKFDSKEQPAGDPAICTTQDRLQGGEISRSSTQEATFRCEKLAGNAGGATDTRTAVDMKPADHWPTLEPAGISPIMSEPHHQDRRATTRESLADSEYLETPRSNKSYFQNQLTFSFLLKQTSAIQTMQDPEDDNSVHDDINTALVTSPQALMAFAASIQHMDGRNSEASLRNQRAIFDIQGDLSGHVLVFTPFQQHLETIPRPEARSMSVSWVVQPTSQPSGPEDQISRGETLRTTGMVRGMWKLMVQPPNLYKLV